MKQSNTKYVDRTKTEILKYRNIESPDIKASLRDNPNYRKPPGKGNYEKDDCMKDDEYETYKCCA